MIHIASHLQNLEPFETTRPDYFLLDYLLENTLISETDYSYATQYTERPKCDGLVPHGYETKKMRESRKRSQCEVHDLKKERRQIQREERSKRHGTQSNSHGS